MASVPDARVQGFSDSQYELHVVLLSKSRLKSSIRTSTLMSGFALVSVSVKFLSNCRSIPLLQVAMVEIEIAAATPYQILIPFSMLTAILIFVHLLSLMLATCLLPELEAITSDAHPQLFASALTIAKGVPVQLAWFLSNILGVALFLVEVILVAFVKFYPFPGRENNVHAGIATLVTIIILTVMSMPLAFYYVRIVSKHKIQLHERQLHQAQEMLDTINFHLAQPDATSIDESSYHSGTEEPQGYAHSSTV